MKLTLATLLTALILSGCGAGRSEDTWGKSETRFTNQGVIGTEGRSGLTEADFQRIMEERWLMAQNEIAQHAQYDLNRLKISDPDARALSILPSNVVVIGKMEVPASEINPIRRNSIEPYTDPTPFIRCPDNAAGARYCQAVMENVCTVWIPAHYAEFTGPWEFSNCILARLGVNVRGR